MRKVELLAPAGNYETMLGAFSAGADAVYLGGQGFGARAFADNFTEEEVISAIRYAHIHGKKIYMTVNTLLKENEINAFRTFFAPYAYAGLDAAIIQDLGIFKMIREYFPWVDLHVSTQMTITGPEGASLLKKLGASRIVPARELSLAEIKGIHDYCKAIDGKGIEIEAFIHGAMCYSYSGACLFSSMVGERSGNRGRCAQPCRLPYKLNGHGKECYPLSLKDMCMVDRIPELIEGGIDSFKIEGRMKKPEYAAGVTSVYRKYIDEYYELLSKGKNAEDIKLEASAQDKKLLSHLYLRSEIGEGYYFRHNSPDMVTLDNPSYNGSDEQVLETIRGKYLTEKLKAPVSGFCKLRIGELSELTLNCEIDGEVITSTVVGDEVQKAQKRPMTGEDCLKQLKKFGNTNFSLESFELDMDEDDIFIPVKVLNDLRRNACEALENSILEARGYRDHEAKILDDSEFDKNKKSGSFDKVTRPLFAVSAMTAEQLLSVIEENKKRGRIDRVYVDSRIFILADSDYEFGNMEVYVVLPYITRCEANNPDRYDMKTVLDIADERGFAGVLVRNLEQLSYVKNSGFKGRIVPDYGLYLWNREAYSLYKEILNDRFFSDFNLPLELNYGEIHETLKGIYSKLISDEREDKSVFPTVGMQIYGRVPMMHTANCIRNTFKGCTGNRGKLTETDTIYINDRTGRTMPVTYDCRYCSNIIWNSVPVSLHKKMDKLRSLSDKYRFCFRIDMTTEKKEECSDLIHAYEALVYEDKQIDNDVFYSKLSSMQYTTGHFDRSAD